jgi:hypothetical protein
MSVSHDWDNPGAGFDRAQTVEIRMIQEAPERTKFYCFIVF